MLDSKVQFDFSGLRPKLKSWATDDVEEWIGVVGDFEHLVGFAQILWPDFMEHDECIFFASRFSEKSYLNWMASMRGDKTAVEALLNHTHIWDIFCNAPSKPNLEMILYVGRTLKDTWGSKLKRDFPDRRITVSFPEKFLEDLVAYEVTFFQER